MSLLTCKTNMLGAENAGDACTIHKVRDRMRGVSGVRG